MSAEDTTQPIEAPALHAVSFSPYSHFESNGNTSIQSATLPSTAIGGNTDTNKLTAVEAPPVAVLPITTALSLFQAQHSLPEYHKPAMSQAEGSLFDDTDLFGVPVAPSSPDASSTPQAPATSQPVHENHLFSANPAHSHSDKPDTHISSESTTSAALTAALMQENHVHGGLQHVSAPHMGDSIEDPMESAMEQAPERVSPDDSAGDDTDDSVEMSDRDRGIAAMQQVLAVAQEERITSMNKPSPTTHITTRRKRPVSCSQVAQYDYDQTGTLQNDSEDEDGGWGSDDEERATQLLQADNIDFRGDQGKSDGSKHHSMEVDEDESREEEQPPAKKMKHSESDDFDVHRHQVAQLVPEDDDIEYTGSTSTKTSATKPEPTAMEAEEAGFTSKPRPSLGNVGVSAKTGDVPSPKASKSSTPSGRAFTSKTTSATVVDVESPHTSLHKASTATSKGKDDTPKRASAKKASALAVYREREEEEVYEPSTAKTPTSRSHSTPSSSQTGKSSSSKKAMSTPKNKEYEEDDDEDDNRLPSNSSSRSKRARPSSSSSSITPSSASRKSVVKAKPLPEELARALRVNARKSIASYLQHESDDMMDFFTQRHVDMSDYEAHDAPPNMLKRFCFIVTGLRSVNETASSAGFIKTQIKALGGKLVNFRTANRRTAKSRKPTASPFSVDPAELDIPQTILISEKPQRTLKYITALANGVPCVHYRWFLACLHQGKLMPVDEFMLPAGYNEDAALVPIPSWFAQENQEEVPYYERYPFLIPDNEDEQEQGAEEGHREGAHMGLYGEGPRTANANGERRTPSRHIAVKRTGAKRRGSAPDQYRVEVIGTPAFQQQWKAILRQVGAKVVERMDAAREYGTLDFILSDSEPTDLHIRLAVGRGLPLCTIDWVLQSIIQREVQDPKSKPAYTLNIDEA